MARTRGSARLGKRFAKPRASTKSPHAWHAHYSLQALPTGVRDLFAFACRICYLVTQSHYSCIDMRGLIDDRVQCGGVAEAGLARGLLSGRIGILSQSSHYTLITYILSVHLCLILPKVDVYI
jgi:hypothetical protein